MKKIYLLFLFAIGIAPSNAQNNLDSIIIKSIYFGGGNWYIDKYQSQELTDFLQSIPNLDEYRITIHSHTDNIGGVEYNKWLSQMRSNEAYNELLKNAVPSEQIFIHDFGEEHPVYDNRTWQGKLRNRRVDIILERVES